MEFGKVDALDQVDFTLPDDPPENVHALTGSDWHGRPKVLYTGATGWSVRKWVGVLYPKGTPAAQYLWHYSRQFNAIEFNTTFYRLPDIDLVRRWSDATPGDFRFCPKVWQTISHSGDLGLGQGLPARFCDTVGHFEGKLGCCFLQLPPAFGPSTRQLRVLEQFFQAWTLPLAVEFRHPDWFGGGQAALDVFDAMQQCQVATVITDVAGRRDVCHMRLTQPRVLIRWVGNSHPATDAQRLESWSKRLQDWYHRGLREAYFFVHQPEDIDVPQAAAQWLDMWAQSAPDIRRRGPRQLPQPKPGDQLSLF